MMTGFSDAVICQRCGRGFVATPNYRDFLARRGVQVKVPVLCMTCFLKTGPLPKKQGEVKWFDPRKRYGFIVTREGQDVFLHQRQILEENGDGPREGQAVRFHLYHSRKGPEAMNVEIV
jgi:CspA family cold shock protein